MIKNAVKQIGSEQKRTFAQLANDLQITRQTLHRFLTGAPTLATVEKIANALQVPPFILLHPAPLAALREWNRHQDHTGPGPAASVTAVCPVCHTRLFVTIRATDDTGRPSSMEPDAHTTPDDRTSNSRTEEGQTNGPKDKGPEEMKLFEE